MANTKPHLEWQWDKLAIHGGSLRTRAEAHELMNFLAFFAGKLPEQDDSPYEADVQVTRKPPPGEQSRAA